MPEAHLVLIGPSGAGKTAVGALVAARLGRSFIDLDAEVERVAGRTVARLFAEEGEAGFRARERAALGTLAARPPAVIAVGAGAPLDPANAALLGRLGPVALLDARPAALLTRLGPALDRPLLAGAADLPARLAAQRAERDPAYRALAARAFDTDDLPAGAVAAAVVAWFADLPR